MQMKEHMSVIQCKWRRLGVRAIVLFLRKILWLREEREAEEARRLEEETNWLKRMNSTDAQEAIHEEFTHYYQPVYAAGDKSFYIQARPVEGKRPVLRGGIYDE